MKKQLEKKEDLLRLDENYKDFLNGIKDRLRTAQIRAALAANSELINFYWQLGTDLIAKQKTYKWGEHFLEQFSHDMRQTFPEMRGFSVRNLQRMRQFAQLYPNLLITPQAVAQLLWGHISYLIHAVKDGATREWYAAQTIKNGWSRSILEMQVESGLYDRQAVSSNLSSTVISTVS